MTHSNPSNGSFQMLTDAPLSEEWNKENLLVPGAGPSSPGVSSKETATAPFASPATGLLKRPMGPPSSNSMDADGSFEIKRRRRGLIDRSVSLMDASDDKKLAGLMGMGASPDLEGLRARGEKAAFSPSTPRRCLAAIQRPPSSPRFKPTFPSLQRSFSENYAAQIKRSCQLADDNPNLTGDFDRDLSLPVLKSGMKFQELKTITCETLAALLRGEFADAVDSFRIVDARYSYEFDGGHIQGAESFGMWDEEAFFREFLPDAPVVTNEGQQKKREILIFHCEFSSERGPRLMKQLRKRDRHLNKDTYPALHHPEMYLLHNGYKEFYTSFPELCEPRGYQPMNDPKFSKEEKLFRKKAKTWAGATVPRTAGASSARLLKL